MKKLYLISNDKIWLSKKNYTSNNDLDNIISCLSKNYKIGLIARKSFQKFNFQITNDFNFQEVKKIKEKKMNIFMISISPFNFLAFIHLLLRGKEFNGVVYLRSDGFLEYKIRYGFIGYYFYYLMFYFIKKKLKIISCSKNFTNVNVKKIVHPSELDSSWFTKSKIKKKFKTDFLYVGRFKKDKGALYLSKIFKEDFPKYKLTMIGTKKKNIDKKFYNKNINFMGPIYDKKKLIDIYDSSRIFILPSYIEGFPKVISESLARLKPVIVFQDIKYVVNGRKGIFISKRDKKNLKKTIKFIFKNYNFIQKKISNNYFYTKNNFKKELLSLIQNEFKN